MHGCTSAKREYDAERGLRAGPPLRDLTENRYQKPNSEELYKVWPTNADWEALQAIMRAGSPTALAGQLGAEASALLRLAQAYCFFWNRIGEFLEVGRDPAGRERRLEALRQSLRTILQVVVIELEDRWARGRPAAAMSGTTTFVGSRGSGASASAP